MSNTIPVVDSYQTDNLTHEDFIMSSAYVNSCATAGTYYGFRTMYLKDTATFDSEEYKNFLLDLFDITSMDPIEKLKSLANQDLGKFQFHHHAVSEYVTDVINIYLRLSFDLDVSLDDVLLDYDDLIEYLKSSKVDYTNNFNQMMEFLKRIFFVNRKNVDYIVKSILTDKTELEDGVNLYSISLINITPLCGIVQEINGQNVFAIKKSLSSIVNGDLVKVNDPLYPIFKYIEDGYQDFKDCGYCIVYYNNHTQGFGRDKLTVFRVNEHTFKIAK